MLRTLFIAAALGLTACASSTPDTTQSASASNEGRDCFRSGDVNGYNYVDEHHVKLSVGASRDYILTTTWNARDLNWTQAVAIHSTTGWICTGNGLGIELSGGQPHRTYPITGIERAPEPVAPQGS